MRHAAVPERSDAGPRGARHRWSESPVPFLALLGVAKLAIHLSTNANYGFQRDELYYIASGNHPALGYVDYPPVTPLLGRLDTALLGTSPWALRLLPAIVGAVLVVMAGLCAREMGAGPRTQVLAAGVALVCPMLLGTNWLFQTVTFDQLTWVLALYLLLRLLRTADRRLWLLLGIDLGVGLEIKLTVVAIGAGLVVAILTSAELRRWLHTPWPWAGMLIAAMLAAPNLAWQVANGLPTVTYISNHSADIAEGGGVLAFLGQFLLFIGPPLVPLFVAGVVLLLRDRGLRPAGVAVLLALLILIPEGKAYYPGPIIPVVLAAGCVAVGRMGSLRWRRGVVGLILLACIVDTAVFIRIGIPLVPQASLHSSGLDKVRQDFADTVGWPELSAQVAATYLALPAGQRGSTAILARNYGEAGALAVYGRGLPEALSPQLSFWYWKPAHVAGSTLLTVGYQPSELSFLCGTVTMAGTVSIPDGVTNQEQGTPILVCGSLRESLDDGWRRLQRFG